MADVHTPAVRRYNMSRIRGKDTKPELLVRKFLFDRGFRYRLHDKRLAGKPDVVLPKYKAVTLIHGCFWHGHEGCKYFVIPKTRAEWWIDKISTTRTKDVENEVKLKAAGWNIIRIYECELRPAYRIETLENLLKTLKSLNHDN